MKLVCLALLLVAAAHALPAAQDGEKNGILVSLLIARGIAFFRDMILNGRPDIDIPVLDPFRVDHPEFNIESGLISFDLAAIDANLTGLGDFQVDRANLQLASLMLDYDIVVPIISIKADWYKMTGALFETIPFYGEGVAWFDIINLRMVGNAQLAIRDKSIVIDEITNAVFSLDKLNARTTGYVGGGDIDNVINAMLNDIAHDYATRFSRHISKVVVPIVRDGLNKHVLEKLDSSILLP